ncbi:MAG: PAC2 family protein [Thermoleophilia bacterium]|nr:PAC2 family protein [Thermoleophilia bacterium]
MTEITWTTPPGPLRRPILLSAFRGWNDAASAASGAVAYLAERHGAERVGALDPEEFFDFQVSRPMVDLSEDGDGRVTWPEVEVHVARPAELERDLVIINGPEPSMRWRTFCAALLDAAQSMGVETAVSLGSLLADVPHSRPVRLTGISSDAALMEPLGTRPPRYAGPTGITGVFHGYAEQRGLKAVSLWAPSPHYAAGVSNAKASMALLRAVETLTGMDLGAAGLQAAALQYEQQVSHAVASDQRLQGLVEQLEAASDTEPVDDAGPLPSGDDLAAELERYLREADDGSSQG